MKSNIHDMSNHCIEDVVMNYCIAYGLPYVYMYTSSWFFNYQKDMDIIGNRITIKSDDEFIPGEHVLRKVLKVAVKELHLCESIFKDDQSNEFVVGLYNSKYCNWDDSYGNSDIPHSFIVKDIDNNFLNIDDPYLEAQNIQLDADNFLKNGGKLFTINHSNEIMESDRYVLDYMLSKVDEHFANLSLFMNDLKDDIDVKKEYGSTSEVLYTPLVKQVEYIVNSRINLSKLLRYISCKRNISDLNRLAIMMNSLADDWKMTKRLFIKLLLTRNTQKMSIKIIDKLKTILQEEREFFRLLEKIAKELK